ncbi:MAG: type I pantothenate kinase [Succinivibrionaceae bacterium]
MSLYTSLLQKAAHPLSEVQIRKITAVNKNFNAEDIEHYYWPMIELIGRRIESKRAAASRDQSFLEDDPQSPFIISISGSVASGKTTMARMLAALLPELPVKPQVDIVSTDCFLFPTRILTERNLMSQKGFPISYDWDAMITFLKDLHSGKKEYKLPIYSHETYDILQDDFLFIENPEIVIVEGLNLLQLNESCGYIPSDFIDFSIYIDVSKDLLESWFLKRIASLRHRGKGFYAHLVNLKEEEAQIRADRIWKTINLPNLERYIEPTRSRADMIITKTEAHRIEKVVLRK